MKKRMLRGRLIIICQILIIIRLFPDWIERGGHRKGMAFVYFIIFFCMIVPEYMRKLRENREAREKNEEIRRLRQKLNDSKKMRS